MNAAPASSRTHMCWRAIASPLHHDAVLMHEVIERPRRVRRLSRIDLHNSTELLTPRLLSMCRDAIAGWAVGTITLRIRYSRTSDFSGTCFYADRRVFINLGRHLKYPYRMATHLAKTKSVGRRWYKPLYTMDLASGYDVVLFVFLHELYHLLVKRSRRNTRQKESMCDRFAARYLVDRFGREVRDPTGQPVPREAWDFQDLDGFVEPARDRRVQCAESTTAASPGELFRLAMG